MKSLSNIFPKMLSTEWTASIEDLNLFYEELENKILIIQPDSRAPFVKGLIAEISDRIEDYRSLNRYLKGENISSANRVWIKAHSWTDNEQLKDYAEEGMAACELLTRRIEMLSQKYKITLHEKRSEQKFEDPLFTLKGSPDEAKAKIIYSIVAGAYIVCSQETFLHFFFNSAIQPKEECIKWIYEKSTNFYPLLFLSVLTTEDYQQTKGTTKNRWRNVNTLFGNPFRRDTDMTIKPRSDRKKYKDAIEALIK